MITDDFEFLDLRVLKEPTDLDLIELENAMQKINWHTLYRKKESISNTKEITDEEITLSYSQRLG